MELSNVERVNTGHTVLVKINRQNTQQHHNAAYKCVQEKLDSRIQTIVATPDPNQEIHRNKHHFPKQEKQQKIESDKCTDHARLQHK